MFKIIFAGSVKNTEMRVSGILFYSMFLSSIPDKKISAVGRISEASIIFVTIYDDNNWR